MIPPAAADAQRDERERMVRTQLESRGIRDLRVLEAMRAIPRHLFVAPEFAAHAHDDCALPALCGQTISQPFIVAWMTQALRLEPEHTVLEVGSGGGYQTAVLARLARRVYAVEWHLELLRAAAERLEGLGVDNVVLRCGDGSLGWPEHAPYDAILVAAAASEIAPQFVAQLTPRGRLVIPVGPEESQTLTVIERSEQGSRVCDSLDCRFVKLLGRAGWRKSR